ncbi:MAG: tetraacyldisaccharide 4'-kinase [Alphaproteobacteria bacterium]|nr:tetraacyldisaccharide 4'-kinase [Alphaproteobacteria bacterium]
MRLEAPAFWYRAGASPAGALLGPLGALYGAVVAWKTARAAPQKAPLPVVCVGNLTLGGTGKTPVALALARRLAAQGRRPVFLTRGYGGRARGPLIVDAGAMDAREAGDEALLLARAGPCVLSRDRLAGARLAAGLGDVVVMDDGHQNLRLEKDLSLLVVDAEAGFGNGRVFPAGPLRERVDRGLARADAVILMGEGAGPPLPGFAGSILRARLEPTEAARRLKGARLVAFAGIGRPGKAFATLEALGAVLVARHALPDHAVPGEAFLRRLAGEAERVGARLVTTQKDAARLSPDWRARVESFAVEARFADEAALEALLARVPGLRERGLQSAGDAIKPAI